MKKLKATVIILMAALFSSCSLMYDIFTPSDKHIYEQTFPAIEWSDDYVFAGTSWPSQVQVWNGKTGMLVRTYTFLSQKYGYWWVSDMCVMNRQVWIAGYNNERGLARLDLETGEFKFIKTKVLPECIGCVPEALGGKGCLVLRSAEGVADGVTVEIIDSDGKSLTQFALGRNTQITLGGMVFSDETLYLPYYDINERYICANEVQKGLYLAKVNLAEPKHVEKKTVPFESVIDSELQEKHREDYTSGGLTAFYCNYNSSDKGNTFLMGGFNSANNITRLAWRVTSEEPFEFEYANLDYTDYEGRTGFSIAEYRDNIFWTGRVLHGKDFSGLECGLYSVDGGDQLKKVRMGHANQLFCDMKEDCAWYSKDINVYSVPNDQRIPQIYKVDYVTKTMRCYNPDGTYTETPFEP